MPAPKDTDRWQARVGDDTYEVVAFLTDAGTIAQHGRAAALLVVDGQLIDSEQLKRERRTTIHLERK